MSAKNGDKARHHRLRKQKIARRAVNRAAKKSVVTPPTGETAARTS